MCIDSGIDTETQVETISIDECARKCNGIASHFAYGTNEFGGQGCQDGFCTCHCIETCKEVDQDSYWFFRYKPGIDLIINSNITINHLNQGQR